MSATTLAENPRAETYNDVEDLLRKICWTFIDKYDGEFDEYFSAANETYLRAYDKFNSACGGFTNWVWSCVWNALLDELRKKGRLKVKRLFYATEIANKAVDRNHMKFDLDYFTRGLSEDASIVVELISDSPSELAGLLGIKNKSSLCGILRDHLHGIGWSMGQITEAFSEIRDFVGR